MVKRQSKSQPTWTEVKSKLASLNRTGLLGLIQDLYAAHQDNQTFLHARFDLGENVLEPYEQKIDRWLWPDVLRRQETSVVKAKEAISSYKKAVGNSVGMAELMFFYCECAVGFCSDIGNDDESYFAALVRMFEQTLLVADRLPSNRRDGLFAWLNRVREISETFGYGVGDNMDLILAKYR
jgi:hypothetical protein